MRGRSPLDYDISVTADKRRRAKQRGMTGETAATQRKCDHRGCQQPGLYRAPKSRDEMNRFNWFCIDHIREFNRAWNYYSDMTPEELDAQRRAEMSWERPTWKFGQKPIRPEGAPGHMDGMAWARFGFDDPMEVLGENATINPGGAGEARQARMRMLPKNERSALEILGMDAESPRAEIRRRYRALVKDLHPDMNGGKRADEDRLRDVLWAWDQLKNSRSIRD